MATVTATITVDFTANYAGPHRVCFRIQGSGDPYDCTTIVNCIGGGTACQAIINTPVNTTSCDGQVTFEGYIQAACEDILSTSGRLAWTALFTPNVICQRTEVECARGPISGVSISPSGQQYLLADTLTVVRNGADPETSDATLSIASVGTGIINSISSLLAGGTLYTALDVLTVVDNAAIGAGATIRVDTVDGGGAILTYTLLTGGNNYIGGFTFTGGTGSGASFDIQDEGVDYDRFGAITGVTISVPGSYAIVPTITITTATGSEAQLTAELQPCGNYLNIGLDCIGGDQVDIISGDLNVGETFATCIDGGLVAVTPSEYEVTEVGCCIPADTDTSPCTDYHLDNTTGGPVNVHVTNCEGNDEIITVAATTSINRCLVTGGVIDPQVVGFNITNTGSPCVVS
jgi:hypothetical protein